MSTQLFCLLSTIIFFSLHAADNQILPLLAYQNSNSYQSLLPFKKNTKTKIVTAESQSLCFPKEIQQKIMKLKLLLCWKDEINFLESISPVKIGDAELWAIDLWRLSCQERECALSYRDKITFNLEECDMLKKIIPKEMQTGLVIHRFANNDELYLDCCDIPGGCVLLRCMVPPAFGAVVIGLGGLIAWGVASHPGTALNQTLTILGGIGLGITVAGWGVEYWRYRWMLEHNTVATSLQDV